MSHAQIQTDLEQGGGKVSAFKSASFSSISIPTSNPPPLLRAHSDPITDQEKSELTRKGENIESGKSNRGGLFLQFKKRFSTKFPALSMEPRETIRCLICLENSDASTAYCPKACTLSHKYCFECMGNFVQFQIQSEGRVEDINCPMIRSEPCSGNMSPDEIKSLVSAEVFKRYENLREIRQPNNRECPNCNKIVTGSAEVPQMQCPDCNTNFCFLHANAHPNSSCAEYIRKTLNEERLNTKYISKHAKTCPFCKAVTEKNGGCNHMTCKSCDGQWCWLCGKEYEYDHYDINNLDGCPGAQFASVSVVQLYSGLCLIPFSIICILEVVEIILTLCVTLVFAIALWLIVLIPFCIMCKDRLNEFMDKAIENAVICSFVILFIPTLLVWLPFCLITSAVAFIYMSWIDFHDFLVYRTIFLYPINVLEMLLARYQGN